MTLDPYSAAGAGGERRRVAPPTRRRFARDAIENIATDWQIVLALRALIQQRPDAVTDLLRGPIADDGHVELIYAAAREAVSAHPDHADLLFAAASAALVSGRRAEADAALVRCLALAPDHGRAAELGKRLAALRAT